MALEKEAKAMSDRHRWIHCKKHNFDYPSGAECPYCVMDATDQFKPDEDAEFIMTEEEPEWVKKLKLNLKLAYWKLRNELYELGQWIRLLWSY